MPSTKGLDAEMGLVPPGVCKFFCFGSLCALLLSLSVISLMHNDSELSWSCPIRQ
jgi:hypothetical protein